MAESRLPVFPSRMVLTALKDRTVAARTGHELLKKKSDAIKARLQKMLRQIVEVKRTCVKELSDSYFGFTEATWAAGQFSHIVVENVKEASFRVKGSVNNVAGVKLPIFERNDALVVRDKDLSMLGLSKGGQQISAARDRFTKTLNAFVELASLQTSLQTLDNALKITNRKVNALEFVIMPQLNNTVKYVISELDELEREDQYRIKKVKDIRTRQEEEELEEKKAAEIAAERALNEQGIVTRPLAPTVAVPQQNLLSSTQRTFAVDALLDDDDTPQQDEY